MAYINSSDVGNFLQQTLTTAQQSELDTIIIPGISAFADDYMNRTYTIDNNSLLTETFDGNNTLYFPRVVPIDTTEAVTVTDNGTVLTLGLDFFVYPTYIELVTPASDYEQGVVITYYTKANNCPADLKLALIQWAAQKFKESDDAGKQTTSWHQGPVSVTYKQEGDIPALVLRGLDKYRLPPAF